MDGLRRLLHGGRGRSRAQDAAGAVNSGALSCSWLDLAVVKCSWGVLVVCWSGGEASKARLLPSASRRSKVGLFGVSNHDVS